MKIADQVSDLRKEFGYPNDGAAFGHFAIAECFRKIVDINSNETGFEQYVSQHIVDLSNDCGNDAIFTNLTNKQVHIFQFKFSESQLLNTTEIRKNKSFIDWLLRITNEELSPNQKIQDIIDSEISDIINEDSIRKNDFEIVFYYIDSSFSENVRADISSLFNNYRDKGIQFQIRYYDYTDLDCLYEDTEIPKNKIDLEIVPNEYFIKKMSYSDETEKSIEIETIVTSVKANSLKKIVEDHKEMLFALNVRYYKGENDINLKIKKEYSKGSKSNFWLLNNGINAVCSNFDIVDNNILKISDYQIVNGGQTTKTLTKIVGDLPDTVNILMKLSKIKDTNLVSKIAKNIAIASNSQNAITPRDLHSGDHIQTSIFERLDKVGIFYDKKDGEWSTVKKLKYRNPNGNTPRYLRIRNEDLGKAYMSFFLQMPISTKGRDRLVFSEVFYEEIFNPKVNETQQFRKLMVCYRISEKAGFLVSKESENFEILLNNSIGDVVLALSTLYFLKDKISVMHNPETIKTEINKIDFSTIIDDSDQYRISLSEDFDNFIRKVFEALQFALDVKKQVKIETKDEEWHNRDTVNWLKKDDTYTEILGRVVKHIKGKI